jgi:putative transposase
VDARLLDNPEVAIMLMESMSWLETKGWVIYAAVVLSTHMHFLMRNEDGQSNKLFNHVAAFKNYTACIANKMLGRKGSFWARDCFDHWIRTPEKFESTVRYIANNPVKARRVKVWHDWKWVKINNDVLYCLDDE